MRSSMWLTAADTCPTSVRSSVVGTRSGRSTAPQDARRGVDELSVSSEYPLSCPAPHYLGRSQAIERKQRSWRSMLAGEEPQEERVAMTAEAPMLRDATAQRAHLRLGGPPAL